jgi:hypothetical protein
MTLAIGHREGEGAILDLVREIKPPFSPSDAVWEFAVLLRNYRVSEVKGDKYAGEWVAGEFGRQRIHYRASDKSKSDLYRELLPLINSRRADLLDLPRLTGQLVSLERRVGRSGRDSIDHPPGMHDDVANAAAGALTLGVMGLAEIPLQQQKLLGI